MGLPGDERPPSKARRCPHETGPLRLQNRTCLSPERLGVVVTEGTRGTRVASRSRPLPSAEGPAARRLAAPAGGGRVPPRRVRGRTVSDRDMIAVPVTGDIRMTFVGAPTYFARHPRPRHPRDVMDPPCLNGHSALEAPPDRWEFTQDGGDFAVAVPARALDRLGVQSASRAPRRRPDDGSRAPGARRDRPRGARRGAGGVLDAVPRGVAVLPAAAAGVRGAARARRAPPGGAAATDGASVEAPVRATAAAGPVMPGADVPPTSGCPQSLLVRRLTRRSCGTRMSPGCVRGETRSETPSAPRSATDSAGDGRSLETEPNRTLVDQIGYGLGYRRTGCSPCAPSIARPPWAPGEPPPLGIGRRAPRRPMRRLPLGRARRRAARW